MNCTEVREEFSALLDGELAPEVRAEVERHLGQCSECLHELEAYKRVDVLYRQLEPVAAPQSFEEGVRTRVSDVRVMERRKRQWLRWTWPVLAASAASVLIVAGWFQLQPGPRAFNVASIPDSHAPSTTPASKKEGRITDEVREQIDNLGYLHDAGESAKAQVKEKALVAAPVMPGTAAAVAEAPAAPSQTRADVKGEAAKPEDKPVLEERKAEPKPLAVQGRALAPAPPPAPAPPMRAPSIGSGRHEAFTPPAPKALAEARPSIPMLASPAELPAARVQGPAPEIAEDANEAVHSGRDLQKETETPAPETASDLADRGDTLLAPKRSIGSAGATIGGQAYRPEEAAYPERDKTPDRIRDYEEALRIDPENPNVHNDLACALVKAGRMEEAVQHLNEAIRLKPSFVNAHINLGNVYASQGRGADAAAQFRTALRLDPRNAAAQRGLDRLTNVPPEPPPALPSAPNLFFNQAPASAPAAASSAAKRAEPSNAAAKPNTTNSER